MLDKINTYPHLFGQEIIYQKRCASTQGLGVQLLKKRPLTEGTVIITDDQYSGRGQYGTTWQSTPGKNLTFSLILYPTFLAASQGFSLSMALSLAIYDVLKYYIKSNFKIKWPNDLYYQDRKLGGMLIENVVKGRQLANTIVGIGLNINQAKFNLKGATSLSLICGKSFHLPKVLATLLAALEKNYTALKEGEHWEAAYLQNLYWIDELHTFKDQHGHFEGKIKGIDAIGRLAVERKNGHLQYYAIKEIAFIQ